MLKKTITLLVGGALLGTMAGASFAANEQRITGVYVDASVGYGRVNENIVGFTKRTKKDVNGTIGNVNLGYKWNENLGIEAGVSVFPDQEFAGTVTNGVAKVKGDENYSIDVAFKGIAPLPDTNFDVFGKAGVAITHHSLSVTTSASGFSTTSGDTSEVTGFFAGGTDYFFNDQVGVLVQGILTTRNSSVPAMYGILAGMTYIA
jgi:Outer membrane protein beta-barrel domain